MCRQRVKWVCTVVLEEYHKILTQFLTLKTLQTGADFCAKKVDIRDSIWYNQSILIENEMLSDEVSCYGLGIIYIATCIADSVSGRSRCYVNRNTRDSLPWFFFIFCRFIYTHIGAGLIDFSSFFGPTLWALVGYEWAAILRKEERRVSIELTALLHVNWKVRDYV